MTRRALALVMLAACLLLLGATAADWVVVEAERTIDTDVADVVIEQTERTGGAEVAGGLYAVGLAGLVVAALVLRFPLAGGLQILLGILAVIQAVAAVRTLDGVTVAPSAALAAGAILVGAGAAALVVRDPSKAPPARVGEPSRYTVEAVRGEIEDPDDEWDIAVADQTAEDDNP